MNQYINKSIINMPATSALCCCLTLILVSVTSTEVKVACQPTSSCLSGKAYTFTSSTDKQFRCTEACEINDMIVDVFNCKYDHYEKTCSTGVCISLGWEIFECTKESYCSISKVIKVNCDKCYTSNCPHDKCVFAEGTETCYLYDECVYNLLHVEYGGCPKGQDTKGQSCDCCLNAYANKPMGICSSDVVYNSEKLQAMSSVQWPPVRNQDHFLNQKLRRLPYLLSLILALLVFID